MVGELLTILSWIEVLPEDELDPDTAVKMTEDVTGVVGALDESDRAKFIAIARQLADEADARQPGDGDAIRQQLAWIGLVEEA